MPHPSIVRGEFAEQLALRGYSSVEISRAVAASPLRAPRRRKPRHGGITTQSDHFVDLANPRSDAICAEDIAHGLAAICRFTGQTRTFYSVAEHSLMVASLVPPACQLRALLHDAAEAYLQDLPTPLKALLPGYVQIESRVWAAIAEHFGLPAVDPLADSLVKHADLTALRVEMRDLFATHPGQDALPVSPAGLAIGQPMLPAQAKHAYLARLRDLLPG